MTRGMYAAAGGMLVGLRRQEVLSNNLANANTPGFKMDRLAIGSFQQVLLPTVFGADGGPARIYQSATLEPSQMDARCGALIKTDNPLDLAVEGDGWFVVAGPEGERYTRDGHFLRAADGLLVTGEGLPVLGVDGPITLPNGDVTVSPDGELLDGGALVGRLRTVRLTQPDTAEKAGDSAVRGGGPEEAETAGVRQGMIESSNADPMRTMVEMISTLRDFELNQRMIQAQDASLQHVLDIARR